MNSTFKVARPSAQLNIVAYTGPPPPKPRRLPAPIRREEAVEENSLPDLPPNVVFDELDGGTRQGRAAAGGPATFVGDLCKASASFVQDAEAIDTHLAAEERSAHRGYEKSAEHEDVHLLPASPVLMPTYDSATRTSETSSPIQDVHTGELELAGDDSGLDRDDFVFHELASAQSPQGQAVRECDSVSSRLESKKCEHEKPENSEPEMPHDHGISSDSDISDFELRNLDDAGLRKHTAFRSGQSNLETVDINRQEPLRQSMPRSVSMAQTSTRIELPHPLPGTRTPPYGQQPENLLAKRKRGPLIQGRPNTKQRSWRATKTTAKAGMLHNNSDSSCDDTTDVDSSDEVEMRPKVKQRPKSSRTRTALRPRMRSSDRRISASTRLRSMANTQRVDGHGVAQFDDGPRGHDASADCNLPVSFEAIVHSATLTKTAVMTGLVTDVADIEPLLKSSAAWGLGDDLSLTRLVRATIKPHAAQQWQLTATFARVSSEEKRLSNVGSYIRDNGLSSDNESLFSIHHESSEDESETRSRARSRYVRRGAWDEDEDNRLIRWRLRGESWPCTLKQFPNRTEGAVKSRWYVVLAPQQRSKQAKDS